MLVCDHASNCIPRALGSLGLSDRERALHVAWDIGAAALTRALARRLGAPAVLTTASRLVIDCTRVPGHPSSIPEASHGVKVPGNRGVSLAERERRRSGHFDPYHAAVAAELERIEAQGVAPALIAIHSFVPVLTEGTRPWHVGVLSDRDRRLAEVCLAILRRDPELVVGDNEPYSGRHPQGYTCPVHGDARGRSSALFEVRQDLLANEAGITAWAERLHRVLRLAPSGGLR